MQLVISVVLLISVITIRVNGKRVHVTRYGYCTNCAYRGYGYQWCHLETTSSKWDYCSTRAGYSTRGQKCKDECGHHGYKYMWCYLEKGSWDYCSLIQDKDAYIKENGGKEKRQDTQKDEDYERIARNLFGHQLNLLQDDTEERYTETDES